MNNAAYQLGHRVGVERLTGPAASTKADLSLPSPNDGGGPALNPHGYGLPKSQKSTTASGVRYQ